jgi:hypothetical protein
LILGVHVLIPDSEMLTLLSGSLGVWILPMAFLVRLLHQPMDRPFRERLALPSPRLRRRGIPLRALVSLVIMISIDCSITLTCFPRDSALIVLVGDGVVISIPLLIGWIILLTPMEYAVLTVLLAFGALWTISPMLGDP